MRVAIVGAGSMGNAHAAGWAQTDAKLVGVIATDQSSARTLAERYGATAYDSLDSVLPLVDAVDICAPTNLHLEYTLKAAAAGKHVFCEKPIARTVEDGLKMIEACRSAGVRLFIGMVVRFFPQYQRVHEAVIAGRIGKPGVIRLTRCSYRPQKITDNWFLDFARSGGPIFDMLVHDYDYARWLAGEVERVYARTSPAAPGSISEYAQVLLRFRNGAMAHVEGGWVYPPPLFRTKIEVAGDGGLIEWESDTSTPVNSYFKAAPGAVSDVALPLSPLAEDPYTAIVKHFYECIMHDKPFAVTPMDALAAIQIGLAAIDSARTGAPVSLSPLPEVA